MTYEEKKSLYEKIMKEVVKNIKKLLNESNQYNSMDDTDIMIVELGDFIKKMQKKYKNKNKKYGQDEIAKLITHSLALMFED